MKEMLNQIRQAALEKIAAGEDLEQIRIQYLGKKGELTAVLRGMGKLSAEERPVIGQLANQVREEIEAAMAEKAEAQKANALAEQLKAEKLDVTMPGKSTRVGHMHPLTRVQRDMEEISSGISLEGAMLKLKLQYFGHLL